jgi:Ca-activated chloride channel family protein
MTQRNVERLLTERPVPRPPEGLAERIKAEIPDPLEAGAVQRDDDSVMRMSHRRQRRHWQLAAAAVIVVALTAAVTWQLRNLGPDPRVLQASGERALGETTSEPEAAPPARVATGDELERVAPPVEETSLDDSEAIPPGGKSRPKEEPAVEVGAEDQAARPQTAERDKSLTTSRQREVSQQPLEGQPRSKDDARAVRDEKKSELKLDPGEVAGRLSADALSATSQAPAVAPPTAAKRGPVRVDFDTEQAAPPPSTGGTAEPNDQPYGDVFFRSYGVNPFIDTEDDPLSTFGLEVDTGSYTVVRRFLRDGHLPPHEAVRVEEFLNAFDYGDTPPRRDDFALSAEGAPSPFGEGERYYMLRFGVAAREVASSDRPRAMLIFVVDTSGSMNRENRLGVVKKALYELLDHLRSDDRVGLVVYGSRGEVLLEPTSDHEAIRSALDRLHASGSTNAEEGLVLAYELADRFRDDETINRVILCSDGVANVGRTGPESLIGRIERYADRGVELTAVGFGMGNYNDVLMEQLADTGNGRYAYVDALPEARRIFVEELTGTLLTLGFDAKAQVEFNPDVVTRYRLLGYENRDIADDRFRDPTVDAGEIGAGHGVTALYEIKLQPEASTGNGSRTVATLRFRYRPVGADEAVEMERPIEHRDLARSWERSSPSLRLATLVAEYAEILKGSYWARGGDLREVLRLAQILSPEFAGDSRVADFISLVAAAADLHREEASAADE